MHMEMYSGHGCHPHHDKCVSRHQIEALWDKITANFATNKQVLDVIADLKRLEAGSSLQATHVAQAAAAMVIKTIQADMEKLNMFSVEIVPFVDKNGHPVVADGVDYNKIYLTPAESMVDGDRDNVWDEWIAVPNKITGHCNANRFKWERVGGKRVDLNWVKEDFKTLNTEIVNLNEKLQKSNKILAKTILNRAIRPLNQLKEYLHSPEYIKYVFEKLPRAAMGTDGLMTANSFALLSMLALWAANDHKVMGGGALGPDVVIHLLEKHGVPCDDLRKKFHHHCCVCEDC